MFPLKHTFLVLCLFVLPKILAQEALYRYIGEDIQRVMDSLNNSSKRQAYLAPLLKEYEYSGNVDGQHRILVAMYLFGNQSTDSISKKLIALSNLPGKEVCKAEANFFMGYDDYESGNYLDALNYLLTANQIAKEIDDEVLHLSTEQGLALLMQEYGDFNGSLDHLEAIQKMPKAQESPETLFMVYYSKIRPFIELGQLEKAQEEQKKAELLAGDDPYLLDDLELSEGIIEHHLGNYMKSVTVMKNILQDNPRFIHELYANFYLGKSYGGIENEDKQLFYYQKADSLLAEAEYISADFAEMYHQMSKIHNKRKDTKSQLGIMQKLISFDSVVKYNNFILQKTTAEQYLIPLNEEKSKEQLQESQQKISNFRLIMLIALVLFLGATVIAIAMWSRERKKDKIYANYLEYKEQRKEKEAEKFIPSKKANISEEHKQKLNNFLEKVERERLYAKQNFSKETIKRYTKINGHTISDYFREVVGMSINDYKNLKRVELSVFLMENDKNYRFHQLKYLAEGVGYNNTVTYNKAFVKVMKIKPIEFQRRAQKANKNS